MPPRPSASEIAALQQRRPARNRASVPPAVRRGLEEGWLASANLVEWLVLDQRVLLRHTLAALAADVFTDGVWAQAEAAGASRSIIARERGIGLALQAQLSSNPAWPAWCAALAAHPSDTVRIWATYATVGAPGLDLATRLAAAQPFAVDPHFGVRECAWMAWRPYLAADLAAGWELLAPWVQAAHEGQRRFAVEVTRPRGVWCLHLTALKRDPTPALPLLEVVRADSHRYVQTSVANWLNDASKSHPDWVRAVTARWRRESPVPATAWIVNHATRTLRKAAKGGGAGKAG